MKVKSVIYCSDEEKEYDLSKKDDVADLCNFFSEAGEAGVDVGLKFYNEETGEWE